MSDHKRLSWVDSTKLISVIEVKSIRGFGTLEDPVQEVIEYFSLEGKRLARVSYPDNPEEIHQWKD